MGGKEKMTVIINGQIVEAFALGPGHINAGNLLEKSICICRSVYCAVAGPSLSQTRPFVLISKREKCRNAEDKDYQAPDSQPTLQTFILRLHFKPHKLEGRPKAPARPDHSFLRIGLVQRSPQ